jgi:hypothetical protein
MRAADDGFQTLRQSPGIIAGRLADIKWTPDGSDEEWKSYRKQ